MKAVFLKKYKGVTQRRGVDGWLSYEVKSNPLLWNSFVQVLSDYIYLEYLQKDLKTFHQIHLSLDVRVRTKLSNVSPFSSKEFLTTSSRCVVLKDFPIH